MNTLLGTFAPVIAFGLAALILLVFVPGGCQIMMGDD